MRNLNFKYLTILTFFIALHFILIQQESILLAFILLASAYPLFYLPIVSGLAYYYFVKRLRISGVKQHLIGGGIAGLSSPAFIWLIVAPLDYAVTALVDRFSPFAPSPTSVYTTYPSLEENIEARLIIGAISIFLGATIAIGTYELWPLARRYFSQNFGLKID